MNPFQINCVTYKLSQLALRKHYCFCFIWFHVPFRFIHFTHRLKLWRIGFERLRSVAISGCNRIVPAQAAASEGLLTRAVPAALFPPHCCGSNEAYNFFLNNST
jgi:hypothetical protein